MLEWRPRLGVRSVSLSGMVEGPEFERLGVFRGFFLFHPLKHLTLQVAFSQSFLHDLIFCCFLRLVQLPGHRVVHSNVVELASFFAGNASAEQDQDAVY